MSLDHLKKLLSAPGNGVYTIHTAKDKKEAVQSKLFQKALPEQVDQLWKSSLEKFWNDLDLNKALLGVCSDNGGGILRGANWGPLFIRNQLLKDSSYTEHIHDIGDIRVIPHLLHDKYLNSETIERCQKALYGTQETELPVSPLSITEKTLDLLYTKKPQLKVIGLGGDHSVSYPLVRSFLKHKKTQGIKVGLIHFDAHTDLLHERLGIDLCFGSWVTHILDLLDSPDCLYQIGIRSTGKDRSHWEESFGIHQIWKKEVDQVGSLALANQMIKGLKEKGVQELYISFDIDALDSAYASATGTPEHDGLSPDQCLDIMQRLLDQFPLAGGDLVEVAPFLKTQETPNPEPESTLMCAQAIINCYFDHL